MSRKTPLAISMAAAMALSLSVAASIAGADIGPPAHLQVSEREPGVFSVRWRVPDVLPSSAVPTPLLPPGCEPNGVAAVTRATGAWLFTQTWTCSGSLAGGEVGLRFPFPDLTLTTVARVDLLSGDRYARLLTPGEPPWRLPQGTVTVDPLRAARHGVVLGATHAAGVLAHVALIVAVALLGRVRRPLRLLGAFSGAQLVGAVAATVGSFGLDQGVGELAVGLAAAVLAAEALRPAAGRRHLFMLVTVAGGIHGATVGNLLAARLGEEVSGWAGLLAVILGTDAAQLVGAYLLFLLFAASEARARRDAVEGMAAASPGDKAGMEPATQRGLLAYAAGGTGAAAALAVALTGSIAVAGGGAATASLATPAAAVDPALPASQRLAPTTTGAPLQSYLAIEPFELRHEVMVTLADLAPVLGLDAAATLTVEQQSEVTRQLADLVLEHTALTADGLSVAPTVRGVDFMSVDATGALPRATPQPEPVDAAMVGIVIAYPTEGLPSRVELSWAPFPDFVAGIPMTVIDPEAVRSVLLSADESATVWSNELIDDPIPDIAAVAVEPATLPIPWLALPLFLVAAWALLRGVRGERRAEAAALTRVLLAVGLVVGPLAATSIAVPGSGGRAPSEAQARRLLAGLLPNVYRALEFRDEARIYDRLAVTVTGDALTDIYLQQRRALELEERGGAVARVEAVEVMEARDVDALPDGDGFSVRGIWTVGGMVTHFGHRHFRQNRYDARVGIVAVDGSWKIRGIEVLEQERVQ